MASSFSILDGLWFNGPVFWFTIRHTSEKQLYGTVVLVNTSTCEIFMEIPPPQKKKGFWKYPNTTLFPVSWHEMFYRCVHDLPLKDKINSPGDVANLSTSSLRITVAGHYVSMPLCRVMFHKIRPTQIRTGNQLVIRASMMQELILPCLPENTS